MNILILHPEFPGQFVHLAKQLKKSGHHIVAMSRSIDAPRKMLDIPVVPIKGIRPITDNVHRWSRGFEQQMIRAHAAWEAAKDIKAGGFSPDVILAHPGWGDSLCLKDVWPNAKLGIYCEYYTPKITAEGSGGAEFMPRAEDLQCLQKMETANWLMHFEQADAGISPTQFQAGLFPKHFQDKISVVFDGIDTERAAPAYDVSLTLNNEIHYTRDDEIVTYVSRNFEPSRGYHTFMRSLPKILRERPNVRIVLVGGDGSGYGFQMKSGEEWRKVFIKEILDEVDDKDWERVHFLGAVQHHQMINILQLSRVHVYLTAPIMLSWSMMEAMSVGCTVVGSDTSPVREMITHDVTGRLVPFQDPSALADEVCALLDHADDRERLGAAARQQVREKYDLHAQCLPAQIAWVDSLRAC